VKKSTKHHSKRAPAASEDAWSAAAAHGCDMNLLEISLRMTPDERIDANQDAVDLIEALQAAGRAVVGRDRRARRR